MAIFATGWCHLRSYYIRRACELAQTGMRVSELCSLSDSSVHGAARRVMVVGKGQKLRTVFWGRKAAEALEQYLRYRRADLAGYLIRGPGSRSRGQLCTHAVRDMLKRRAIQANITLPAGATCHEFQHGWARPS